MIWDSLDVKYMKTQLDKLSNLNISLSDLRDALIGADSRSMTDLYNMLNSIYGQLDVSLSTRASESTLSGIKSQTDKLTFDSSNNLLTVIQNFPSWFTGSTKLTDDIFNKLDSLDNALASVGTDKLRVSIVDAIPSGDNLIGRVKISDGTNLAGLISATLGGSSLYALAVAPDLVKAVSGGTNYVYQELATSTTEASASFSPNLKFAVLSNQDTANDVLVRFNDSAATQIKIPSGTAKVVMFPISTLYYVASAGTPTLVVTGFQ